MNIIIYGTYRIEIHSEWSVRIGYDEFEEQTNDQTIIKKGGELIDILKKYIENYWFQDITFKKDKIEISYFNFNTGEGSDHIIKITPIPDEGEE